MTTLQACLLLFCVCVGYNWLISRVINKNPQHGLTSLWVVAGVLGVLLVGALVNDLDTQYLYWPDTVFPLSHSQLAAWLFLRLFAAAGLPMVAGSLWRYLRSL